MLQLCYVGADNTIKLSSARTKPQTEEAADETTREATNATCAIIVALLGVAPSSVLAYIFAINSLVCLEPAGE